MDPGSATITPAVIGAIAVVSAAVIGAIGVVIVAVITRSKRQERPQHHDVPHQQESLGITFEDRDDVFLANLPITSGELFGRDKELAKLDAAWENDETNLVSLVAWGGVGKTALVKVWLSQMARDQFRHAERVYGWSFYSQGATEGRQASSDQFIAHALRWFRDPNPDEGAPGEKGRRLAALIRQNRNLLILDGLEPLQYPPGEYGQVGRLKDPDLQSLLQGLAYSNPGLCLITTRLAVDDLKDLAGNTVERFDLEELSTDAGVQLLESLGVSGERVELEQAVGEYEGHALALTLLGQYPSTVHRGHIRQRDKIPPLTQMSSVLGRQGIHARRVMESYEGWFEGKAELSALRIMGLFDRPVDEGAFQVLIADPGIEGLTTPKRSLIARVRTLQSRPASAWTKLSYADRQVALTNLRHARLLAPTDPQEPDTLDTHPLVREHFSDKLKRHNPAAWKEAHSRLYEYYKSSAKECPDTLEEMAPLYAAVRHGCEAGRHQEALEEVYVQRIQRGAESFNTKKLGALGVELAALSGFFDPLWSQPVAGLTEDGKGFVLNEAGFDLRALGRLTEAALPMQAALEIRIAQEDRTNAAINASNLSQLYLTIGDLPQALAYAEQSVNLADRRGNAGQRVINRSTLADARFQTGRLAEADALFQEAEAIQKEDQPQYALLYSLQGFLYCDLLLNQGKHQEVQDRAIQTLEWGRQAEASLLSIALDHLSLGRSHLFQAQQDGTGDFSQATDYLDQAVDGLRQAGAQEFIVRGLMARAELHRVQGAFDQAQRDLEEATSIAERGGMRLHQADCHLGYTRLYLAMRDQEQATEQLDTAGEMINNMGYHRRDRDVAQLEKQLEKGQ